MKWQPVGDYLNCRIIKYFLAGSIVVQLAFSATAQTLHLERLPITVNRPVDARFAPHTDKYLYVCEHFGKVRVAVNGLLRFEPFLDIDYLTTDQVEQAGLLSIALSPDFKRDKTFWVCYIDNNLDQVVARYTAKKFTKAKRKGDIIFTSSVLVKNQHYGGTMHFGADGMLYMATGDGGDKTEPQDLTSERGKLLRIDPYTGAWEVVAYGFRHPWKWSFDRETGDAWIGDVGDVTFEEVNHMPAGSDVLNFGWPIREANWDCPGCTDDSDPSGITYPVKFYHHYNTFTGITGICAIGGYVYRGSALPWLRGQYVWGDFIGKLWARDDSGTITDLGAMATTDAPFTSPVGFFQDKAGELYVIDLAGADLFKLTP